MSGPQAFMLSTRHTICTVCSRWACTAVARTGYRGDGDSIGAVKVHHNDPVDPLVEEGGGEVQRVLGTLSFLTAAELVSVDPDITFRETSAGQERCPSARRW